ncbi:MAG TPA: hypothetical protein DIU15_09120 [Deltaproteobacteria bacterium]|nr:hypothetical protein [Deltaproteobacteria bacterium]
MAAVHMLCGRPEEAKVLLQQVLEQEPVAAPRRTANRARITMAMCLLTEGMQGCAAAEQLIRHLVTDDASEPSPWIRAPALLVQVDIDVLRKEWASAVGHLEAYIALYEGLQSPEFVALGGGGLALVRARQGRLQEAEALVAQALEGWPRSCPYEYATLLCWAAEVYVLGQKHEAAKEAMAEARRWMEEMQVGSASPLGRALAEATAVFDASTTS